jgi:hypothetical protein
MINFSPKGLNRNILNNKIRLRRGYKYKLNILGLPRPVPLYYLKPPHVPLLHVQGFHEWEVVDFK